MFNNQQPRNAAVVFLLLIQTSLIADSTITSKTFFSNSPLYSTGRPEHLSFYRTDRMIAQLDSYEACFQTVLFGGQSTHKNGLANYFLPHQPIKHRFSGRENYLIVAEGPSTIPDPHSTPPDAFVGGSPAFKRDAYDLLARSFNIETAEHNFQSNIAIQPKQSFIGFAFNYTQNLSKRKDKGFWFDLTMPIVRVKNAVHLEETVTHSGTSLPRKSHDMTEAFMNPRWEYGKISPCPLTKSGIADIELRVGYDFMRSGLCSFGAFYGAILATGNRPHGEFMFEPVIGRNRHWGMIWGGSGTFKIWENIEGDSHLYFNIDMNNNYLFHGRETRSFDLRNKPWSRYMPLFADASATKTIPGINVLTKDMIISPGSTYQLNSALTFDFCDHFVFEAGWYLYARDAEDGRLYCRWEEGPGIAGVAGADPANDKPIADSMSNANMHTWNYGLISPDAKLSSLHVNTGENTLVFKTIKAHDLDLQSALHPAIISNMIYGSFCFQDLDEKYPWFTAIGAGYQFGSNNATMHRWSVWAKASLSV